MNRTMKPVVLVLWHLRIFEVYRNGDGNSPVFNYWNPLTWMFLMLWFPIVIVFNMFDGGISNIDWAGHGFAIDPFFKKNPDKLEWVKR